MPLISFPWLFEKQLARIATGIEVDTNIAEQGLNHLVLKGGSTPPRRRGDGGDLDFDDFIQQEDGVIVHRGEILDLFRPDVDSEDLSGESDFDDARHAESTNLGDSTTARWSPSLEPERGTDRLLSGTGVEDVVPQVKLEGLTDPREITSGGRMPDSSDNQVHPETVVDEVSSIKNDADKHLQQDSVRKLSTEIEEIEEEVVELEMEKTSIEKLAELMALKL